MKGLLAKATVILVTCLLAAAAAQSAKIPSRQQVFINDLAGKTEMVQVVCPQVIVSAARKSTHGFEGLVCFRYDQTFSMLKAQFALYDNQNGAKVHGIRNPPNRAVTPWKSYQNNSYGRVYMWLSPPMGLAITVHLPLIMFTVFNGN